MEIILLQVLFLFCLFVLTVFGTFTPFLIYWLKNEKCQVSWGKILHFGNCVASGAFFALCFMHLVPQTQQKWRKGKLNAIQLALN